MSEKNEQTTDLQDAPARQSGRGVLDWLYIAAWVLVIGFYLIRFIDLGGDFTHEDNYSRDGVLYTDEGWYAGNAVHHYLTGEWYHDGDLNFGVNLPTLQVLHRISFAIFGLHITSARMTITFCFTVVLGLLFLMLRKLTDRWTALLAIAIVLWNYFFFLYSRFAIAEIPMTMFACFAFASAYFSDGKRGWYLGPLVGVCWALSFLTKSSGAFALPIFISIVFLRNWSFDQKLHAVWKTAAAIAGAGVILLIHRVLLVNPYYDDFLYFPTLNVGMRVKYEPLVVADFFLHMTDKMRIIDKILYRVLQYLPIVLIVFVRDYRRNPLVWFCIIWFLIYSVMFSFYVNLKPRYWVPLFVPFGLHVAITFRQVFLLWQKYWPERKASFPAGASVWAKLKHPKVLGWTNAFLLGAFSIALIGSAIRHSKDISEYLGNIEYTFETMIEDVKEHMGEDRYLLSHFAITTAMYVDTLPINDRYAVGPLEERLERYRPRWILTEDTIYRKDSGEETGNVYPGLRRDRLAILERYYTWEEVEVYDVFSNYNGYRIYLYKLTPKPELGWEGEAKLLP